MGADRVLLEATLKRSFYYYLTTVNNFGEEQEAICKVKKKEFLERLGNLEIRVILVEKYPPQQWKLGVFYVAKDGKAIYYKEKLGQQFEF